MRRMKRISFLILSAAMTIGIGTVSYAGQWQSNSTGWWWQEDDGTWPVSEWKEINGKYYYFGADGYMLANTTTPDGYYVDASGAWVQNAGQTTNQQANGSRVWEENANLILGIHEEGLPTYYNEYHNGDTFIIDSRVNSFVFPSSLSDINADGHEIWIYGLSEKYGVALGDGVEYKFEYDKDYNLDFTGTHPDASTLSQYCKENDVVIVVAVVDENKILTANDTNNSRVWQFKYATETSVPTGKLGQ